MKVRTWLKRVPGVRQLALRFGRGAGTQPTVAFSGSADYWRARYAQGGDSGAGSYGKFATFKARVLNEWFEASAIQSVVEFGSGDGNQLELLRVPQYLGVDVSHDAVARCQTRFANVAGRRFVVLEAYAGEQADAAMSLDVIYHLVEDAAFDAHMRQVFGAAHRMVIIYSSNRAHEGRDGDHVRHRVFTDWVDANAPSWRLTCRVPNDHPYRGDWRTGSFADFYFYARVGA